VQQIRVVHYLNQFFARIGGEAQSDAAPGKMDGPVGPGVRLDELLGEAAEVVGTVYCGDSHIAATTHQDLALAQILELISSFSPDVVIAGPSFGSGRYGLACGLVSAGVRSELGVPVVTGMHEASPGTSVRSTVPIVATSETAAGMGAALATMAALALKLARGEPLAPPEVDGYLPMGFRRNELAPRRAADRAVSLLLSKIKGEPVATEWPVPRYETVPPPEPLAADGRIPLVALVTEGGVVPKGNPDRFPGAWAKTWAGYDISGLKDLTSATFESVHGGFDTSIGNEDPDRLIPLDALRDLEDLGVVRVKNVLYSTVGNMGSTETMQRLGSEIAAEIKEAGVDLVIVGST